LGLGTVSSSSGTDSFAVGYLTDGELRPLPTEDGWYRTGDLAERDADGLRITGRLGDVSNIAGGRRAAPGRRSAFRSGAGRKVRLFG
jgi:acyl-CoA synthetase (AMP-forming)/AMP-acid ligase II